MAIPWILSHDQAYHTSFYRKLESIQYDAALALIGVLLGTSKEKIYQKLGFEPLQQRRIWRKLSYFCKIFGEQSPDYLSRVIPK